MAKPVLQEFETYRFGARGTLTAGDKFRARGGPYHQARPGAPSHSFNQAGVYTFIRYCEAGWYKFIVARLDGEAAVEHLYVGLRIIRQEPIRTVYAPYKISKVRS